MIENEEQLQQTLEQVAGMYRAMAALRRDVYPLNRKEFGLLSEGPMDQIREMVLDIQNYVGWTDAEREQRQMGVSAEASVREDP